ncbi:MAG: hypothetical protein HZA88_02245 [Verrucomicrobia bacterium]|nr:hypothetical protein [Verrucomicrobiota bacterium]
MNTLHALRFALHGCIGFLLLCGSVFRPAFAADTNAPADFTVGSYVLAANPQRFGVNLALSGYPDYNNWTADPGMEAIVLRRQATATGGGANWIENSSGATTSHWDTLGDGFFNGATVRVYRVVSGAVQLVRTDMVRDYGVGFSRVNSARVTATQFTDGGLTPGATYYYAVRAYDTSGNESTNSIEVTVVPLPGSTTGEAGSGSFTATPTDTTAPSAPSGVGVTPLAGGAQLNWTPNTEPDIAGYNIYRSTHAPSLRYRIYLANNGPVPQAGDMYFLDLVADNAPMTNLSPRIRAYYSSNDTWREVGGATWPWTNAVTKVRDSSTVCPENGGRTSMKLTAPGAWEVSLRQYRYAVPDGYYTALIPGRTYRVEAWLRQEGVSSGSVTFKMDAAYSSISHSWTGVTSDWQKFTWDFVAPAYPTAGQGTAQNILAFVGPGSVWVDNLLVYDPSLPRFTIRPAAVQALQDYRPSVLRIWTGVNDGNWGTTLDDWTSADPATCIQWQPNGGRGRPEYCYKLPQALQLCRDTGATPWLNVGIYMTEAEWQGLIEYLAAPYDPGTDTPATKPWAYRRYSQGHAAPWTDDFDTIQLEVANETWNPTFAWVFPNGTQYGQFAEYFLNTAKASPYFAGVSGKFRFVVNGFMMQPDATSGYGHAASLAAPSSHANDVATYIGGWEAGVSLGGTNINDGGFQDYMLYAPQVIFPLVNQHAAARDSNAVAGHSYDLALYEGGPGYANPSPGQPYDPVSEVYGKSLAAGVATLDTYLYDSMKRVDPQSYFTFAPAYNWASHSFIVNGYNPHTSWLALQMRNRFVSGSMLATAINSSPTTDIAARTNRSGTVLAAAMSNVPLIQPYAFRNGSNYSVFVLSRRINGDTPVTLRLPFNAVTNATLYTLTGDPRIGNSSNYNINITTQAVTSFSQNFQFSMPPGSAYLYVFDGATTLAAPAQPTASISRAPGQTGSTTTPAVQFIVNFSEPVSGFTAGDVIIDGTSGANLATVTDTGTTAGMTFTVTVTGMTSGGTVTIQLAAGAVNSVATGLASLASSTTDSGVTYSIPPPMNQILAYDDFNVATNSTPVPPFLNGVVTGTNWTGAWVAQGFNGGTNYTDGFKVIATNALAYSTLRTSGNYAGGGGTNYATAGRYLDLSAFSAWAFSKNGTNVVGLTGTELWMSVLMRKNSLDDNMAAVILHNSTTAYNAIGNSRLGVGYYGAMSNNAGQRYWSLAVRNAADSSIEVIRSDVPIVAGQTVLLVLRMRFGTTDTFDLFVNPSSLGGDAPASPNATKTTTGAADIFFRALAFSGNNNLNSMALDEIRLGDTYAAVTPPNAAGSVQFGASGYSINEDDGSATIYVTRTGGVSGAVSVDYATSDGTAIAGTDYTAINGTLTWADGDGSTKSFTVPILNGGAYESDETINLALSNATGASLGSPSSATLTISSAISATPTGVDLLAASDTGASNSDRLTNLDNSAPGKALTFRVSGTVTGATVTLYDGAIAIGSATVAGTETDVTTDGATTLGSGVHFITAAQTASGKLASAASPAVSVTIDTASLLLTRAVSRKVHGSKGTFDLNLNLAGTNGTVEPRLSGPTALVFTFNKAVTAVDGLLDATEFTLTNATYSSASIASSNLTLNLAGIPDQSRVTVVLKGLSDLAGNLLAGTNAVKIRSLYGDANQSGTVNIADMQVIKFKLASALSATNFLYDINLNGLINIADMQVVKTMLSHTVPVNSVDSGGNSVLALLSTTLAATADTSVNSVTLGEALGAPELVWNTDGDAVWTATMALDGSLMAWSGSIGHLNVSWVETTVTGPGTLSFQWKVSSETDADYLTFSMDGEDQPGRISGEVDWQTMIFSIPSGTHRLTWTYAKNRTNAFGVDAGWLRRVSYRTSP